MQRVGLPIGERPATKLESVRRIRGTEHLSSPVYYRRIRDTLEPIPPNAWHWDVLRLKTPIELFAVLSHFTCLHTAGYAGSPILRAAKGRFLEALPGRKAIPHAFLRKGWGTRLSCWVVPLTTTTAKLRLTLPPVNTLCRRAVTLSAIATPRSARHDGPGNRVPRFRAGHR